MRLALALLLTASAADAAPLTPKQTLAVYAAAGLTVKGTTVIGCAGDTADAKGSRFAVTQIDLNVDGRAEVIVSETNSSCFGTSGHGFTIVGQDIGGRWHRLGGGVGIATVLHTRHIGWFDIGIKAPDGPSELHWAGLQYK